jgi:hypothetical protein
MEQRKYVFSLVSGSTSYSITGASLSFNLTEGYPYLTAHSVHTEEISELMEQQYANTLINKDFAFDVTLTGIKSIINLKNLVIGRMAPSETPFGYGASLSLIPRAVAFSTAYPAVFHRKKYDYTVKELIKEIYEDFNDRFPTHKFNNMIYGAGADPIALIPPRFVQIPYFDMIRRVAQFHGLSVLIDFDSNLRVFSAISKNVTPILLGKHNVADTNMTFDSLQTLAG